MKLVLPCLLALRSVGPLISSRNLLNSSTLFLLSSPIIDVLSSGLELSASPSGKVSMFSSPVKEQKDFCEHARAQFNLRLQDNSQKPLCPKQKSVHSKNKKAPPDPGLVFLLDPFLRL